MAMFMKVAKKKKNSVGKYLSTKMLIMIGFGSEIK